MEKQYGIWNTMTKRFVYGIRENSEKKAYKALWRRRKTHYDVCPYAWRYEVRVIPDGYKNLPNSLYRKQKSR